MKEYIFLDAYCQAIVCAYANIQMRTDSNPSNVLNYDGVLGYVHPIKLITLDLLTLNSQMQYVKEMEHEYCVVGASCFHCVEFQAKKVRN